MAGAIKRGVMKMLVGPIAKRLIGFLESKGWIYPGEADDFRGRLSRFLKAMIELETGESTEETAQERPTRKVGPPGKRRTVFVQKKRDERSKSTQPSPSPTKERQEGTGDKEEVKIRRKSIFRRKGPLRFGRR